MLNLRVTCVVISSLPFDTPQAALVVTTLATMDGHGEIVAILGGLLLKGDWISAPNLLYSPGLCFCWENSIMELLLGGMLSCL